MEIVAALESVDAVTLLDAERPVEQLKRYRPDVYIKGGDYSEDQLRSAPLVRSYGGRVVTLPSGVSVSTSQILQRAALLAQHWCEQAAMPPLRGLVALDRDGTLIEHEPYLHRVELVRLLPGVGPGLQRLQEAGLALVIITNQQGIALGYYSFREFAAVNQELFRQLSLFRVRIWKVYFCPHSAALNCGCRKPGTRLLEQAMRDFEMGSDRCFLIGDEEADIEAARRCGWRAWRVGPSGVPFAEAIDQILAVVGSARNQCTAGR